MMNPGFSEKQQVQLKEAFLLQEAGQLRQAALIYEGLLRSFPDSPFLLTKLGTLVFRMGETERSIRLLKKSIELAPNQPDALSNLGTALTIANNFRDALYYFESAINLRPDVAQLHYNQGLALRRLEENGKALESYYKAVKINPNYYLAHNNIGNVLKELKRHDEALAAYTRAVAVKPDYAEAYSNRGTVFNELNRHDDALADFARAIALKPDYAEAYWNRGVVFKELNRYDDALTDYSRAIAVDPDFADAYCNRGIVLSGLNRFEEALSDYNKAIAIKPDYAEAYSGRGIVLSGLKRYEDAVADYSHAIAIEPDSAETYNNRGLVLNKLKRYDEALADFAHAIAIKPDLAEAYSNRGNLQNELRHYAEARADYDRALALKKDIDYLKGNQLHTSMMLCVWSGYQENKASLIDAIETHQKACHPFPLLALSDDLASQREATEIYVADKYSVTDPLSALGKYPRHSKIKIGYFSADFHNHATLHLMAEMLECHDRSQFELIAFSFGPDRNDSWRQRAVPCFDQFIDARTMSDREVALLARKLEIDIAVDLKGFTQDSRIQIFIERAAPVQVNYLGYPGTLGTASLDYLIADRILIPEDTAPFYAEKIVYLPNSYQANDTTLKSPGKRFTRTEAGLPEDGFVFCCFNNTYKILPEVFDVWMRLLKQVEGSVIWLFESHPTAAENLRKEAEARGIDRHRLIFAKLMPIEDHLARIPLADLLLDTFPYNAHTTASDALRKGLPLITYAGKSFASRVAASLLNAVGMPELVTHSLAEYEALALDLAMHPETLGQVRTKLNANLPNAPLYQTPLFTRHIEAAYRAMYDRYQNDQAPDHIHVVAS